MTTASGLTALHDNDASLMGEPTFRGSDSCSRDTPGLCWLVVTAVAFFL